MRKQAAGYKHATRALCIGVRHCTQAGSCWQLARFNFSLSPPPSPHPTLLRVRVLQGVFHVELKYTSRGPRLIEVNCRMGGGPVRLTNLLVWGVDLVEEHLLTTAGIPSRPPVSTC